MIASLFLLPRGFGAGFALLALLVGGCAMGPDFERPEAPAGAAYTAGPQPKATVAAAGQAQRFVTDRDLAGDWWLLFKNEDLARLMEQALAGNQDLQAAQARLRRSRNLLRAGYGVFYPQIDGNLEATRQRFSAVRYGGGGGSSIFNLYSASLAASYRLDLFGRSFREVEGKAAQVDLQKAQYLGTYLTLLGNVVNAAVARAAYRGQIEATEQTIEFEKEQVAIFQAQYEAGIVPEMEVLSLRSQLAATRATLAPLQQGLARSRHLLAVLRGRLPATATLPEITLDDFFLPDKLPLSLPSRLVRQRPDILAAEASLHQASAEVGVATADLFPSFDLSVGYGTESTALGDLFSGMSTVWNLGANLTQPLFEGGRLRYQRKAALDAYDAARAAYRQTVLDAFGQVADALRALEHDAQALQARAAGLSSAERNLDLVRSNYRAGIASYLDVLVADRQYQQARLGFIQARATRLQDTAVLFTALGGGWWNLSPLDAAR